MRIGQPPLGTPLNSSHPLSKGLMLSYSFNEGGGNGLINTAGNRQSNGVLNGFNLSGDTSNWLPGKHGKALDFAAKATASNYVSSSYVSTPLMTIAFWIKIGTLLSTDNVGILFWNGTTVDSYLSAVITGTTANSIVIVKTNQAHFRSNTSITALANTGWRHITFVINKASAAGSRIHIDGTEITYTNTGDQTFLTDTGFNLNHFVLPGNEANNRYSPSVYNDLKIWNRLLSHSEVRQLYTNSYQMFYAGRKTVPVEFINKYKFNNRGLRPRPFAPCLAR